MVLANRWRRFGACLIDTLIFCIPLIFFGLGEQPKWLDNGLSLSYPFYILFFVWKYGQTIGKMLLKVQVLKLNGSHVDLFTSFKRYSVDFFFILALLVADDVKIEFLGEDWDYITLNFFIAILFVSWFLCDAVAIFCNSQKRALHDYIAGTAVFVKH